MGILNVTPDSFSDGGSYDHLDAALERARQMCDEGVDIIDIGGESTRPGAPAVSSSDELSRVLPLINAIVADPAIRVPLSIDTSKPEVMRQAVGAGVSMVNDVRALREPGALETCADLQVPVCLMHMKGEPRTMQKNPQYGDVVAEVTEFLQARADACIKVGMDPDNIVLDPGFGFGKNLEHNLCLLKNLRRICQLGFPVLVGVSRKSMFQGILGAPVDQRLFGSLAAASLAADRGAKIVRVHDVKATVDAMKTVDAVNGV
ncbi:MAG: dihydropteroate synthase [Gammaproteobacteria bacterium]|nr:dihydropteroate synthase [Gammaproteobacteria bacterium]